MAHQQLHGGEVRASPVVLLLVDVINNLEFDGGERLREPALEMAPRLAALKRRAREAGVACIYANDNWGRWRSDFAQLVEACRDTRGWPAVRLLLPDEHDYFVLKAKHSAFHATPLDLMLRDLAATTLVIAGLAADNCVLFTAGDAYMREYRVVIPVDCVASEQEAWRDAALVHMERVLKATLVASPQLDLAALAAVAAPGASGAERGATARR